MKRVPPKGGQVPKEPRPCSNTRLFVQDTQAYGGVSAAFDVIIPEIVRLFSFSCIQWAAN
jgi:hypothetical protein